MGNLICYNFAIDHSVTLVSPWLGKYFQLILNMAIFETHTYHRTGTSQEILVTHLSSAEHQKVEENPNFLNPVFICLRFSTVTGVSALTQGLGRR